MVKTALYS